MATTVQTPTLSSVKLVVPTGFEQQQAAAQSKQRLADALMQQGLDNQTPMISPFQALGHWADVLAAKKLGKQATQMQVNVGNQLRQAKQAAGEQFYADLHSGAPLADMMKKYGNNPLVSDDLGPLKAAYQKQLEEDQKITVDPTGYNVRAGQTVGHPAAIDPNKTVYLNPITQQMEINWPKITADNAAQGLPISGQGSNGQSYAYTTSAPNPVV